MSALIVAFRRLLYLFHDVEKGRGTMGGIRFVSMGRGGIAESRWAGTLLIRKDHQLVGIHICPCPYQEETETRRFHYTNSLIGDIAMVIYM